MRALAIDETALAHGAAVDEGRGVAGNENEDLGGVAEAVIADGEPVDDVAGNVVEKDQPQRDAAEQIEPQVALGRDQPEAGQPSVWASPALCVAIHVRPPSDAAVRRHFTVVKSGSPPDLRKLVRMVIATSAATLFTFPWNH